MSQPISPKLSSPRPQMQTPTQDPRKGVCCGIICGPRTSKERPDTVFAPTTPRSQCDVIHGHVKLLVLLLSPIPSNSPLMCLGTLALAQHCIATRRMSSTSSSRNLSWRFASLLFRSLAPFSSTAWPDVTKGTVGCVNRRFEPGRSLAVVVVGEETRDSRFTHSRIRAWMPADNCEARERM
jgi:hypothetical protein